MSAISELLVGTVINGYKVISTLGKPGAFGDTYLAVKENDIRQQNRYALKIIRSALLNEKDKEKAMIEVNILRDLNHPFIIKYIDHFEFGEKLCIV